MIFNSMQGYKNIEVGLGAEPVFIALSVPRGRQSAANPLMEVYRQLCTALQIADRLDISPHLILRVTLWDIQGRRLDFSIDPTKHQVSLENVVRLVFHRFIPVRIPHGNDAATMHRHEFDLDSPIGRQLAALQPGYAMGDWGIVIPNRATHRWALHPELTLSECRFGQMEMSEGYLSTEPVPFTLKQVHYSGRIVPKWWEADTIFTSKDLQELAIQFGDFRLTNSPLALFEQTADRTYRPLSTEFVIGHERADWHLSMLVNASIQFRDKRVHGSLPVDLPIRYVKEQLLQKLDIVNPAIRWEEAPDHWRLLKLSPGEPAIPLDDNVTLGNYGVRNGALLEVEEIGDRNLIFFLGDRRIDISAPQPQTLQEVLNRELRLPEDPSPVSIVSIALEIDMRGMCRTTGLQFEVYYEGATSPLAMDTIVRELPPGPLMIRVWAWAHIFALINGNLKVHSGYIPAEIPIKKIVTRLRQQLIISHDCSVINLGNAERSFLSWGGASALPPDTCLLEAGNHLSGLCLLALVPTETLSKQDWPLPKTISH